MMDTEKTATVLGVKATVEYGAPENEEFRESNPWTVTLRYKGRQLTTPFYTGYGIVGEPDADDVLNSLLLDAGGYENAGGFEDWCAEYGYDTDSRRAERIFRAVEAATKKLRRFLGSDYERALWGS